MAGKSDFVVGLDIGTTKICAVVAEKGDDDTPRIIGVGITPSYGLRKGVVVNLESTIDSIEKAIELAEDMAKVEIESVFAGIAGGHIKSFNSRGTVPITHKNNEITNDDVNRAISMAKAISIPIDREVIHTIPQEFIVDGQGGIKDPRGMSGVRLEAEVHIVTGAITSAQNIIKCIQRAGFEVEDIVLQPLASSMATLTQEEKDSGVILIDIGGGTTDAVLYVNGAVRHTYVLSLGGDHITNDVAIGLKVPLGKAEEIKKRFGSARVRMVNENEEFMLPGVIGRAATRMQKRQLVEIIELRMEELFDLVKQDIERTNYGELISSGLVLTGGTSLLKGSVEMAEDIFGVPVRLGTPRGVTGLVEVLDSPIYSTGVGLAQYGLKYREKDEKKPTRFGGRNIFTKIVERMTEWVGEYF
jgi:cell division protein FtsA